MTSMLLDTIYLYGMKRDKSHNNIWVLVNLEGKLFFFFGVDCRSYGCSFGEQVLCED